jgi:signal transduction histidine kinase
LGIICYNAYLYWRHRRMESATIVELLRFANLNMFFDYFSVTLLVHYTGGVLSPLVWFYSIHIIVACIFFKRNKVVWMSFAVWLVLLAMFLAEFFGWLPHQAIYSPDVERLHLNVGFLFAVLAGAAVLWTAIIWLTTLIIARVRAAENDERELQTKYRLTLEELQESEKKRQLYRRSMTHELRSPIAAAQSLIRIMLASAFGALNEKQQDGIRRVSTRLDQIMDLLQDLLTIERASRTEIKYEAVPLKPLLERLVNNYQPQIEERKLAVDLQLADDAVALVDADDAKAIFSNLISNAVKYNHDGGTLRVSAVAQDSAAVVAVADSGIGVPKKDQERLFAEFFRAANAKERTAHGTGLGLAIVRSLVHQNNGLIDLQSEENRGTTVTVMLPRAAATAEPTAEAKTG